MRYKGYWLCSFCLLAIPFASKSANQNALFVRAVFVQGNDNTDTSIVLRELSFKPGDKIDATELTHVKNEATNAVYRLGLFSEVKVLFSVVYADTIEAVVHVRERFAHHPQPLLQLADRNFTDWWENQHHNFDRLVLGATYMNLNLSGHNDKFWLSGFGGYSKGAALGYQLPYFTKRSISGIELAAKFSTTKQVKAYTLADEQKNLADSQSVFREWMAGCVLRHRVTSTQSLMEGIHFYDVQVADKVVALNPHYLGDSANRYTAVIGSIRFEDDKRDAKNYPLKGYYWSLENENWFGLNRKMNINNFFSSLSVFQPLGKGFYISAQVKSKISLPFYKSYYLQKGLGYEQDYVRGFENKVIDGQHFVLMKLNVKCKLFDTRLTLFKRQHKPLVNRARLAAFAKTYFDAGYVHSTSGGTDGRLPKHLVLGMGGGIDVIAWYDMIVRLEYSVSHPVAKGAAWQYGFHLSFDVDLSDGMHISKRLKNLFSY